MTSATIGMRVKLLAAAILASLALCGVYLAAGGASYKPAKLADPCKTRQWRSPESFQAALDQIALSAADGAACKLGVSREELVIALRSRKARSAFGRGHHLSNGQVDAAIEAGLRRAVDDARRAGAIGGIQAFLLQRAIDRVPIDFILSRLGRP